MMKKMDNTRSHSWWWDSHICPKNSKWLQENLSEMDSKVSAMLRIIEEDADSFAKRAEMYYKKRPELINLVEEFYRTYRALVERYTYLSREIRQNIAPTLQAQLGVSSESAQNSPVDLHLKRSIDGPDIISPSYSYTGASEFDYDSPTEVSAKGQTDDEISPLEIQTNYERRAFGFRPRCPNLEENSHGISESGGLHGTTDVDAANLQKEVLRLQEENKDLASKSTEHVTKLENLQEELSSLQSRLKCLEAEDKLTKKRLKSIQEKEQKLEAENLKLSHALISSKEEKTELLEQKKKVAEDSRVADLRIKLLEDEKVGLKAEVLAAQSHQLESQEAVQKLQTALTTSEEERLKGSFLMEIFEQQSQDLLKKISDSERQIACLTDQACVQAAELHSLQTQLTDALQNTQRLEQALDAALQEKTCTEQDKSLAVSQSKELQTVVEEFQREKKQQARDIARLKETILKLEDEGLIVQSEKMESAKYLSQLETMIEDGQRLTETLRASCRQCEDRCKGLEVEYDESNKKLLSSSQEVSRLEQQVQTLKDIVTNSQKQSEVLQKEVFFLVVEKSSLMADLEQKLKNVIIAERQSTEMQKIIKNQKEETEGLHRELGKQVEKVNRLEEEIHLVSKEKIALVEKEKEALMAHQHLKDEHSQLKKQIELNVILTEELNSKLHCLKLEKEEVVLKNQQVQENLVELQALNTVLSGRCLENQNAFHAAEEAAQKAEKEAALSLSKVEKLLNDSHAKDEVLSKTMSDVDALEAHIARYKEEKSVLGKNVEKCVENIAAIEAQNNVLTRRLSELGTLNTALVVQVSESEKTMHHLTNELTAAQRKIVEMEEDRDSKNGQNLGLQEKIVTLDEQLKLLHAELLESSFKNDGLEAIVKGLQIENSEIKEANQALFHEQQGIVKEVELMKSINQDLETKLSHLAKERESFQEEAITHSTESTGLRRRIESLETDYEAAEKESATLRGQLAEMEEESSKKLFEAQGRVQDLQLKLSNMLAEEASLAEQLAERINSIHTLETALFDAQKNNTALNGEIGHLQQQISSFKIREASLLNEMHESSDLIQALSVEMEKLRRGLLEAEETGERFSLREKKALEECLLLQEKIENLQQDFTVSCEEKALVLRDIASHSGRSSELECEVKTLEAEKDCLQQELFRAQQVEHQLKEESKKLEKEREKLSCTVDFQRRKMEKQEEDLQSLQFELSRTKDEKQGATDKMKLFAQEKSVLLQRLKEKEQETEEAMENCLRLKTDLADSQKLITTSNIEIENKLEEVRVFQANTLILQAAKSQLEQKLELWSRQALEKEEKEKTLVKMLAAAQEENSKLELHIVDAKRRMIETDNECNRHREGFEDLKQELEAVCRDKKELEQELLALQEDKTTCHHKLEKLQQELRCLQDQKEKLDSELKTAILQGHENVFKLSSLQEQLLSAEPLKLELDEKCSKVIKECGAAERRLQEEILQLRLASIEEKNEQELQKKRVLELKDEICHFQAEKEVLISHTALIENQMLDLQQHIVELKSQLLEKQENCSRVSVQAELLQGRVLSRENISLELQKQVQVLREENQALILKIQCSDGELARLKDNLKMSEVGLLELQAKLDKSQGESKSKEVAYKRQGEEHVSLKLQIEELTVAFSNVKAENATLETKLAQEIEALDAVNHEFLVLKEEKGDASNGHPAKISERSLCALQAQGPKFLEIISKIHNLDRMLCNNVYDKQLLEKDKAVMSQENLSGRVMKQLDLQQPFSSLDSSKRTCSTEALADKDFLKIKAGLSSSSETMNHDQEALFDAMVNAIDSLQGNMLILLNGRHQATGKSSLQEQQEHVSSLRAEIGNLKVDVQLYKKGMCHLKKILEGEQIQEDGEVAHSDVRVVQVMLHNLQKNLAMLEEEVRGLREEAKIESRQKRHLQLLLTDLQVNGLSYALLLQKKMVSVCRGMKLVANEWNKKAFKGSNQIVEGIEKLCRAEVLCSSVDIQDDENKSCVDVDTHLASQPTGASTILLQQLQKRVEEFSLLCEAVEDMFPPIYKQDQCNEEHEQGLGSTFKESNGMDENHAPLPHQEPQLLTEPIESVMEIDEDTDSIVDNVPKGLINEDGEIVDEVVLDQRKEADLFEGLAQLHINLGMRLHQALLDEKLESALQELKEERKKLKDDLQARVEEVQSMEAELEKLKVILETGREGDEILDPRRQQQWLQSKKKAEKRARKLSRELLLQREHVKNMQDTVVAWTEQQELATEILEKQVLSLVSKECSRTMEGWDANQVTHLMQEMQSRKALTRRHSMDLQSVGKKLQRVGSSFESTQRKFLKKEEQEQEANQDSIGRETVSANAASEVIKDRHKLSRFGLAWLILLFSTGRRGLSKERPKARVTATTTPPNQTHQHHIRTSTVLSSVVAQTRKMGCCACAQRSDQVKSLDDK
ncbi:hypothetical protein L7F22_064188 [Adiantum nelumboides]|nr:hypothetical protein [Adiantum nelumboides]